MASIPVATDGVQEASVSATKPSDLDVFKHDLKEQLRGVLGQPGGRTGHLIKYLYSSIRPNGSTDSGADLWNRVTMLGGDRYYIPTAEAHIVDHNTHYLKRMFAEQPAVVDLGVGDLHALMMKSLPTLKAVDARSYVAFDINESFAINASDVVKRQMPGVASNFVHGDFTKPTKVDVTIPTLLMMYGCTLNQYPMAPKPDTGEVTLGEVLTNIGNMVGFNAILIATIDTNTHAPSATDCYTGQYMDQFQRNFWPTAKTRLESSDPQNNYISVEGDLKANPADAVVYAPRFEDGSIVHSFLTKKAIQIAIDGEKFDVPRGAQIDIGFSQKNPVAETVKVARKSGWNIVGDLWDGRGTVRALVLAGKNVSLEQKMRAAGKLVTETAKSTPETAAARNDELQPPGGKLVTPQI